MIVIFFRLISGRQNSVNNLIHECQWLQCLTWSQLSRLCQLEKFLLYIWQQTF